MSRTRVLVSGCIMLSCVVLALPGTVSAQTGPPPQAGFGLSHHAVCGSVPTGFVRCFSQVVEHGGRPGTEATAAPTGLSPATLQSVYGFTSSATAGAGKTIAIVDAYDDPTAAADLSVFSSMFGLPACTTANGCFAKVNQSGGTSSYPAVDGGWALEISLDIQWAHAIAPGAKILLVEASSNSFMDLLAAEDYAKTHAQYVSNSWGGSESLFEVLYDSDFAQAGVSIFASSGDNGLPAEYPSASPNVISVGGTTLHFDASNNFTGETGWSGGGGGCSAFESATPAQATFGQYGQVNCGGARATPDVSLDADPASGLSVYDSTPYSGQTGWFKLGGTSVSSPIWAARSAVQGVTVNASYVYGNNIGFRDINVGNNGASCLAGFDLCSGRGSWADSSPPPPPPPPSPTAPGTPSLSAAGGNAVVHLTWTAPADGGSAITSYDLYRGTVSNGESLLTTLGPVTTFDDTAVSNGTTYFYRVRARNAVGAGPLSNEASATPTFQATSVKVTSPSGSNGYKLSPNRKTLTVTVALQDNLGQPVRGASVAITISWLGLGFATGTGTTSAAGTASFRLNNAPAGTYSTTVTNVVAAGLTWDGATPSNSFTK
jgi:hypothetical protein